MMDAIALAATGLSASSVSLQASLSVSKKAMDMQELIAQGLVEMIQAVPPPATGTYIDTYA